MANRKITNKQIVKGMDSIVNDLHYIQHQIHSLTAVFDIYVEYKGDAEAFEPYARKELQERADEIKAQQVANEKDNTEETVSKEEVNAVSTDGSINTSDVS